MNVGELKAMLGMNSRTQKVRCSKCGKELIVPNMYREEDRKRLKPYCCASTVLIVQWMLHHRWHVSSIEANPPHQYYCPNCFPKGTSEYHKSSACDAWCEQVEKWMKENNGKQ